MPNFADIQKSVSEWLCVTEHEKAKTPMTVTFEDSEVLLNTEYESWMLDGENYVTLLKLNGKRVKVTVTVLEEQV